MLILYYKPTCVFSERVIQVASNLHIPLDLKDISVDATAKDFVVGKIGAATTPFFIDTEKAVFISESSDIIDYLRTYKADASVNMAEATRRPRVHISNAVCESCEG